MDPRVELAGLTDGAAAAAVLAALDGHRVVISAPPDRCVSLADQAALFNATNLVGRMFAHVALRIDAGVPCVLRVGAGETLLERLSDLVQVVGPAEPAAVPQPGHDLHLAGRRARRRSRRFHGRRPVAARDGRDGGGGGRRLRLAPAFLLLLVLAGCDGTQPLIWHEEKEPGPFPAADRPVAHIVSSRWSTEEARDRLNEATEVMNRAKIARGMTVADLAAEVAATAAAWTQLGALIEGARMGAKQAVREAASWEAKQAAAVVDWEALAS